MARKPRTKKRNASSSNSPEAGRGRTRAATARSSEQAENRGASGRFQPGRSGNPGGRPKELGEVKELARAHTVAAIQRLAEWMLSDNPKASVAAASILLDRGWGKATQPISGEDGKPIDINLNEVRGAIAGKLSRIASRSAA